MNTGFRDHHERLKYLDACETALRMIRDRYLIEAGDSGQLLTDASLIFGKGFTSREVVELLDRDRAARSR